MSSLRTVVCLFLLACVLSLVSARVQPLIEKAELGIEDDAMAAQFTALQTYVNTPDMNFAWTRMEQWDEQASTYKVQWLNMTSQQWLTANDTDRSIWWHMVALVIPNNLNPAYANRGLMYMTGGNNNDDVPKLTSEDLLVAAVLAQTCETVVTVLFQIPNQPVHFYSEKPVPKSRSEDAMIAYGWAQFLLNPEEPQWLARLPMTKAGVRAMDAATAYWQGESGSVMEQWIVAGASKRGWTTWTVGACDPERVVGIIPMVLDELNFVKNIHHHWRAYGGWSFALTDYIHMNLTTEFDSDNFAYAMSIVDPIVYTDILTMPKLIISTSGDEFLMPDNNDYYWSQLQGEKHFHQFPNLEHTMAENIPLVLDTIKGFVVNLQSNTTRPNYLWEKLPDGTLHLEIDAANPPANVSVWHANTIDGPERRDFRLVALMNNTSPPGKPNLHPVFWYQSGLEPISQNDTVIVYEVRLDPPSDGGWVGFMIQMIFPGFGGSNFRVSTATSILPLTFPYPDCYAESCVGTMV